MNDQICYYSVYMKHIERGFIIRHDCFELKIDSAENLLKQVQKLIPKRMRKDDWELKINRLTMIEM